MNVLVLGCGRQGRAAIWDLARDPEVTRLTIADADASVSGAVAVQYAGGRAVPTAVEATDALALSRLLGDGYDVCVDLLPRQFIGNVGAAAVEAGVHLVNTYYDHDLRPLADAARERGVALLPELGMDPGIDLVLAAEAVRRFDTVTELLSYGGGLPEPAAAATNPLQYKLSWTWEGVLNSYDRPARLLVDGQPVELTASRIFEPRDDQQVEVAGLGELEAFPNGDAVRYVEDLGLSGVRRAGRYALRYPGHKQLWLALTQLGFLATEPVPGLEVSPREFMLRHLEPRLQYQPGEADLAILRVEVAGLLGGQSRRLVLEVLDRLDPETELLAMARTVGFPAAIGARLLASGTIAGRGLLSPLRDVPYEPFVAALAARGVMVTERWEA